MYELICGVLLCLQCKYALSCRSSFHTFSSLLTSTSAAANEAQIMWRSLKETNADIQNGKYKDYSPNLSFYVFRLLKSFAALFVLDKVKHLSSLKYFNI